MFELQHWDYVDEFSTDEMAGLMIGIDPRSLGKLNSWRTIEPVSTRIERDYKSACEAVKIIFIMYGQAEIEEKLNRTELGLFSIGLQNALDNYSWLQDSKHVLDWIASNEANFSNQKFDRASIKKWLVEFKLSSKYNFGQQEVDESSAARTNNLPMWPWGSHTTRDLEDLRAAAIHWWSGYSSDDPASAPKNENVMRWLMEERGTVEAKAKNIASILRPRDLKSGPRVQHAVKK